MSTGPGPTARDPLLMADFENRTAERAGALALQLAVSVCVQPTVAKALTVGDDDDGLCKRIRRVQEPKVQRQAKQ